MNIPAKFKIGDTAYITRTDIIPLKIREINIKVDTNKNTSIVYSLVRQDGSGDILKYGEQHLYLSKFEAAKAWLERQELEPNDVIQSVFDKRKIKDQE